MRINENAWENRKNRKNRKNIQENVKLQLTSRVNCPNALAHWAWPNHKISALVALVASHEVVRSASPRWSKGWASNIFLHSSGCQWCPHWTFQSIPLLNFWTSAQLSCPTQAASYWSHGRSRLQQNGWWCIVRMECQENMGTEQSYYGHLWTLVATCRRQLRRAPVQTTILDYSLSSQIIPHKEFMCSCPLESVGKKSAMSVCVCVSPCGLMMHACHSVCVWVVFKCVVEFVFKCACMWVCVCVSLRACVHTYVRAYRIGPDRIGSDGNLRTYVRTYVCTVGR